jgi:hypothetical protein
LNLCLICFLFFFISEKQIIDEKSLIKKYQREISTLKLELDQLRRGMLVGVSHEELMSLKQQVRTFPKTFILKILTVF